MNNLAKILNKGKLALVGVGLTGMLNLNGCATNGELLAAAGTGLGLLGKSEGQVAAGLVAKSLGDNMSQRESAEAGKTEVNVYGNGQITQGQQTPAFDYSKMPEHLKVLPNLFVCNYWDDKNRDKIPQFDEIVGLKNEFYSNEPITVIEKIENLAGGTMNIEITPVQNFISYLLSTEFILNKKYDIFADEAYISHYFPPATIPPGKEYGVHLTTKGKGFFSLSRLKNLFFTVK